jgi:hypothetical protein
VTKNLYDISIKKMVRDYAVSIIQVKINHLKAIEWLPIDEQIALLSQFHSGEDAFYWWQILESLIEKSQKRKTPPPPPPSPLNP